MPRPKSEHRLVRVNLVIPEYMKKKWDAFVKDSGQNLTALIKESVNHAIEQNIKNTPEGTINNQIERLKNQMQDLQSMYLAKAKEGTMNQEIQDSEDQKNRILLQLEKSNNLSQREIEVLLAIPKRILSKLLIEMVEDKLVEFVQGKWRLAINE